MNDSEIVKRISDLTEEEHGLEQAHAGSPLDADELDRLRSIEVALDQCWDLLRQRRARRDAGQDPDTAHVRPESVVENYQQ
jgi:uncharacterized protein DUF2630